MRLISSFLALLFLVGSAAADAPSTHGMLLFGRNVTYASHLPMFHAPHDYQLLLKLKLEAKASPRVLADYEKAKSDGDTLFTIEPERMDLTQVISGKKKSFSANLYRGHFERGGKVLGQVQLTVEKIVYSAKLKGDQTPESAQSYLIFGEKTEYFAAHVIQAKPSFDFVAELGAPKQGEESIPDAQLPVLVSRSPSRDQKIPKQRQLLGEPRGPHAELRRVIYQEEAELAE